MEIRRSGIKDAGLGVFSTMAFKSGATFGPYAGEKVRPDVPKVGLDTSYMWEVSFRVFKGGNHSFLSPINLGRFLTSQKSLMGVPRNTF